MMKARLLRMMWADEASAGYVNLQPTDVIQPSVTRPARVGDSIDLAFDDQGHLVGIELLGMVDGLAWAPEGITVALTGWAEPLIG